MELFVNSLGIQVMQPSYRPDQLGNLKTLLGNYTGHNTYTLPVLWRTIYVKIHTVRIYVRQNTKQRTVPLFFECRVFENTFF